jgi:DNA polymerase-3 subunit delta
MILSAADFEKSVGAGEFAPGYLLAGNELYFRDRFRALLLERFAGGQREDVVEHDLGETPLAEALDDAASLGLFASRRLLWLRHAEVLLPKRRAAAAGEDDADGGPRTTGRHSLEEVSAYFQRPQPATLVVFEATSFDLADRDDLRKVERLEKLLPIPSVRLDRLPTAQAARCLVQEARAGGFKLDGEAARTLAESCAGDLARAARELEKLALYAAGRAEITTTDVEKLVTPESSFAIWELSDAIGERDARRALRLVQDMLQQDVSPLLLTSLIAGQVRKLLKVKEGAREWVHPNVRDQARKFTVAELSGALEKLFEADVALRSSPPDERVVLERLVLDLARKPQQKPGALPHQLGA